MNGAFYGGKKNVIDFNYQNFSHSGSEIEKLRDSLIHENHQFITIAVFLAKVRTFSAEKLNRNLFEHEEKIKMDRINIL